MSDAVGSIAEEIFQKSYSPVNFFLEYSPFCYDRDRYYLCIVRPAWKRKNIIMSVENYLFVLEERRR